VILLAIIFLTAFFSNLLLKIKGSSRELRRRFLLWYFVCCFGLFLLTFVFIPLHEYLAVLFVLPLLVIARHVVIKKTSYPHIVSFFTFLGGIWALVSFIPYLNPAGVEPSASLIEILTFPVWFSQEVIGLFPHFSSTYEFYNVIFWMPLKLLLPFLIGGSIGLVLSRIWIFIFRKSKESSAI